MACGKSHKETRMRTCLFDPTHQCHPTLLLSVCFRDKPVSFGTHEAGNVPVPSRLRAACPSAGLCHLLHLPFPSPSSYLHEHMTLLRGPASNRHHIPFTETVHTVRDASRIPRSRPWYSASVPMLDHFAVGSLHSSSLAKGPSRANIS